MFYIEQFWWKGSSCERIVNDIAEYLDKQEIKAHRLTIMTDIEFLKEFGIDIITIKLTHNKYFSGNRNFELPEVKLLIDAVEKTQISTRWNG